MLVQQKMQRQGLGFTTVDNQFNFPDAVTNFANQIASQANQIPGFAWVGALGLAALWLFRGKRATRSELKARARDAAKRKYDQDLKRIDRKYGG